MLDTIKQPLRKLVIHLFGPTKGPRSFKNSFYDKLLNCKCLPICNFKVIALSESMDIQKNLLKDQEYLYTVIKL